MSDLRGREIVLLDPNHPYAIRFLDLARAQGMRAVCLYSDAKEQHRGVRSFPVLGGPDVSASYLIRDASLEQVADHLRAHHDVVGVVPHMEPTVAPLVRLAELLDLPWAQPEVLPRFRDKFALKTYLRSLPDAPRINAIAAVRTETDVLAAIGTGEFEHYVLKPNDGYGNTTIGFFDADGDPAALRAYLQSKAGAPLLMEEYIGGEEYFVDGQMDAEGAPECFTVWKYRRREVNGQPAVSMGDIAIPSTAPEFPGIVRYAEEVMRATGLRSSPFHLELKIDDRGPCLIEVAARLAGGDLSSYDPLMHVAWDPFAMALHYYVGGTEHLDSKVDWGYYDSHLLATINGISTISSILYEVDGVDEVEARPDFVGWAHRPWIGARLIPTVDLLHRPWRVVVRMPSEDRYDEVAAELYAVMHLNESSTGLRRAVRKALAYRPLVASRLERLRRSRAQAVTLPVG